MEQNARSVPTGAAMKAGETIIAAFEDVFAVSEDATPEDRIRLVAKIAAAIDRETALPELIEALKAILEHVEDPDIKRQGGQCTLCHTYRIKGRAALAKAGVQA